MSSPAAGAARISRPARQSSRRRAIAGKRSSGAGGTPALVLHGRVDHRSLDLQAPALEVLARGLLDRPHLIFLGATLLVERGELALQTRGRLFVAGVNRLAEVTKPTIAPRVQVEQLRPQPRQPATRLGADRGRAHEPRGTIASA